MDLSSLELIRLIDDELQKRKYKEGMYETFVSELMTHKLQVSSIFRGWNGIDSEFCITLIYFAIEHSKGRIIELKSFTKDTTNTIFMRTYARYASVCKLPFVPCIKGLETILKRRAMKK